MTVARMASSDATREIITSAYAALAAGDARGFLAFLDDDIVVTEPPGLPYGGVYRGISELKGMFAAAGAVLDMTGLVVGALVVDGDRAVASLRIPIRGTDRVAMISEHWRLREGRAVELTLYWFDPDIATVK
jgi:ketosteroid isomerase-like protein